MKYAARRVREADPKAVLVLGGMAILPESTQGSFLETLIKKHRIAEIVDVVNVHSYPETCDNAPAENYFHRLAGIAALLPPNGPDLWMAEFGYSNYRTTPH